MPYVDFPDSTKGMKERKAFWLSDDGIALVRGWRRQGVPVLKIAEDYIGISQRSFQKWREECQKMQDAVMVSKEVTNMSVEEALLQRALGYDFWEETYEMVEGELVLVKTIKKHMAPDVKAIMHFLYNRMPNKWRSIQEPLESTQYVETVRNILVAMQEVAVQGTSQVVEVEENENGEVLIGSVSDA